MRFGYHHSAFTGNDGAPPFDALLDRSRRVEDLGFDLLTVMDHVWQLPHTARRTSRSSTPTPSCLPSPPSPTGSSFRRW